MLPPDRDTLPALLAGMLRDEDLGIIAHADYGLRADEHLAALRRLVHDWDLALGAWVPSEVLELIRWRTPADGHDGMQEHRCCAFACTMLLRALCQPKNHGFLTNIEGTLIRLVDSLSALDRLAPSRDPGGIDAPAAAFLISIIPHLPSNGDDLEPFFGLALLWFALATEVPDDALVALTDWIMVTERDAPSYSDSLGWPLPGPWLIDKSFNGPDRLWQVYGTALLKRLSARHGGGITDAVHLIAAMLEPSPNDQLGCRRWLPPARGREQSSRASNEIAVVACPKSALRSN